MSAVTAGANSSTLLAHPFHLHGYSFAVLCQGTLRNITNGAERAKAVRQMFEQGQLQSFVDYPALKDVLAIPGGGYTLVRFRADNPGTAIRWA